MFRALTLVTVLTTVTLAAVDGRVRTAAVDPPVPREAARQFNALVADVHDRRIDRDAARARIRALLPSIAADFHARGGVDAPADAWRFPLATYGSESIGGKNGSGYQPAGYDWFDGYMSHGHPAHDIFIRDRGEDELDDATGKAVEVLSISSGTVVALATDWVPGSILRGGRYVYVYDPMRSSLFYYAHLRSLHVELGDIVSPGQAIATVGRSGRNAAQPRSPTHLHVMCLVIEGDAPRARDIYRDLLRLGRRRAGV